MKRTFIELARTSRVLAAEHFPDDALRLLQRQIIGRERVMSSKAWVESEKFERLCRDEVKAADCVAILDREVRGQQ